MSVPHLKKGRGYVPDPAESVALQVSEAKGPPLLLLNTPTEIKLSTYSKRMVKPGARAGGRRGGTQRWVDMPFEHWFVAHTYHGDEFRDPEEFLKAKLASGLTLSVVVLTSNDATRIHSVVMGLRRVLQEMHPIADQIVVVDAASGDGTREIAQELGAEVYDASDILPQYGVLHGRGESTWKSLAVAKGDVIVWLDPRARRFHPSTALSLAGPLLRSPELQLVEAFSAVVDERKKPTAQFSPVDVSWGGFVIPRRDEVVGHAQVRVQALKPSDLDTLNVSQIAMLPPRTIFQVLCPALAGVISPFARDVAARRDALLDLPVFAGEAADVGVLLSVASEYGTNAVAQVELGYTQPAPPPQPGLRNAIELLQVMAGRLTDPEMRGDAERLVERVQREIEGKRTSGHSGTTGALLEVRALGPVQRPPMRGAMAES
jgi:glucosyl-3-phosphoglycerate synthase